MPDSRETEELIQRAEANDSAAIGELFTRHESRLRRMLRLRMDRRLQNRVDVSDVLQETYIDAMRCFREYKAQPGGSFYVWLRCIAGRRLTDLHRHHLGVRARDARREISLDRGALPEATSAALAAQLLGSLTSPSEAAVRAERTARVQEALERMDPIDREVLALRHFEQLSNAEVAEVLAIQESAASKRHLRALRRLKDVLKSV